MSTRPLLLEVYKTNENGQGASYCEVDGSHSTQRKTPVCELRQNETLSNMSQNGLPTTLLGTIVQLLFNAKFLISHMAD